MSERRSLWSRLRGMFGGDDPQQDAQPDTPDLEQLSEAEVEPAPPALAPKPAAAEAKPVAAKQAPQTEQEKRLAATLATLTLDKSSDAVAAFAAEVTALIDARQTSEALYWVDRGLLHLPEDHALRLARADALCAQRRYGEALADLELLADAKPESPKAHFLLAEAYQHEANPRRAMASYEKVLACDFAYPRALSRMQALRRELSAGDGGQLPTVAGDQPVTDKRYVISRTLGTGGGGTVFLARDTRLDRPVALKHMHRRVAARADVRVKLFHEARLAASIQHPQVIEVYDIDEQRATIAMEYCAGGTLEERVQQGTSPLPMTLRWLAEMARALDIVHAAGIVHRDIKPGNWLLRHRDPRRAPLVLTDFGIAHVREGQGSRFAGSLAYLPPEVRSGDAVTPSADLFGCGAIAIALLVGRPPLTAQQALEGTAIHQIDALWETVAATVPADTPGYALLRELTAPDPAKRPQTATALLERATQAMERVQQQIRRSKALDALAAEINPDAIARLRQHWDIP